jgi:L-alanine-DL-glutamate epimerase-like enolase superfamily enzyme
VKIWITGALQVADLAYAFELPVSIMNCPAHFMAHVAAVLPNHIMMEVVEPGWDVVLNVDNQIEDGWIVLGDRPGNGLEFNEAKLQELTVDRLSPTSRPIAWGRRRGAGLYEVGPKESEELPLE